MKRLKSKVAIVTGAGSGMGAAEGRLFAEEGASVLLTDIREDGVAKLAAELSADGLNASSAVLDVTDEAQWRAAVDLAITRYGQIDVLVNNAGMAGPPGPWDDANADDFTRIMDINVRSQFLGIKAVTPHMENAGGGSIVNISSISAFVAFPNVHPAYTASKAGSHLLTKTAALEFAKRNIRINSVHPGFTETPMVTSITAVPEILAGALARIPMGRIGQPIEVARAVLFLASDEASYITGSSLVVDGGITTY